ncbi:translational activator [Phyllosticta capitalensis]
MAEVKTNGVPGLDLLELRREILSSSTKRRISKLRAVEQQLRENVVSSSDAKGILLILFDTYPLYVDRASRTAIHQVLRAVTASSLSNELTPGIVKFLQAEATKTSVAPTNFFSLAEWASVLLQEFGSKEEFWRKWGVQVITADAAILETCLGSAHKEGLKHSALVVTRRALRRVFKNEGIAAEAVEGCVKSLTTKGTSPTARNAVFLGILAGVCARLSKTQPMLAEKKKAYYEFYVREIIGSRTILPKHITNGLYDFFVAFTTENDLKNEVIPSVEKALLRSPEVVLNELLQPMLRSLPKTIDLSEILQTKLLKPLLSSIKSTNVTVRTGALTAFEALLSQSANDEVLSKVADEVVNPLKQNKVTVAEQKVIHAQILCAVKPSEVVSKKIVAGLAPVALKEPNEAALAAETMAVGKHFGFILSTDAPAEAAVTDAFVKGLGDKRQAVRRVWALRVAELLWEQSDDRVHNATVVAFIQAILQKLVDTWHEVAGNPVAAVQSGLVTVAYIATAFGLSRWSKIEDEKVASLLKKTSISQNALVAEPKPSFLLNHRVYSKLTAEEDLTWGLRALASVIPSIVESNENLSVEEGWSQAFIYFVSAGGIAPRVRQEAIRTLSQAYALYPSRIAPIIINGLWLWRRNVELNEKDTAATSAKTGNNELALALRAICLTPEERQAFEASIDESSLQSQLVKLLVLARPQLIPRTSWIDLCLKTGVDPGELTRKELDSCLEAIIEATKGTSSVHTPTVREAAYAAAADLAFVAPDVAIPRLVEQIKRDLDPKQLEGVGPEEAAIFRTPEGQVFVDVLAKKGQNQAPTKGSKDYDTWKWEQELREQLAQKKGSQKKLTKEEQEKVNAQLAEESKIRKAVAATEASLRRGVGIIRALATGPPTEANLWLGPSIDALLEAIDAGAGLVIADASTSAYIACAERISPRLGVHKPFFGVALLRAKGVPFLPPGLEDEPLGDLVTRLLYRLRFLSEQRPLDSVSLTYILPLIFFVLESGSIDKSNEEEADEQILLALEFLSFHTDSSSEKSLPRAKLISTLIYAMQRFTQHFKIIKDCLMDLCRGIGSNLTEKEISSLVKGAIVPQVSVRTSVLQAIDEEVDLIDIDFSEEVWLACHDDVQENVELAQSIWTENGLELAPDAAFKMLPYLDSKDKQLRRAAARSVAECITIQKDNFHQIIERLKEEYKEKAKPRVPERDEYGMPRKMDLADPWEVRNGIAMTFRELAAHFQADDLVPFISFMVQEGPLGDRSAAVRDEMVEASVAIISSRGQLKVEELMELFERALEAPDEGNETSDKVNEAVIILYGALARHLPAGDARVPKVVQRLLQTLSTPSETVQYAVAECLPPLVRASNDKVSDYLQHVMDELLNSKKYATRRGAAYGLAGIVSGKGLVLLHEKRIMSTLKAATENKKDPNQRQGAFLAFELLSLVLGRIFEPYVIQIVPQLLAGFGDSSADVREACLDAAKVCFGNLSSFGVKQVLPTLLEGLDDQQWRSKKGACDSLGAMAYLAPQQLALSLPEIIPPLTTVLNDSHKEVRASAKRSLQRFGEVISNPEVRSVVDILLKALSDPTKYTDEALDSLIKINFVHYLDAPSLALVVRILERGLSDRSNTKRKAAQIIGSLAHLTERKDLVAHLPILVAGLRMAIVDPVPTTRATASKALGSTVEKLGEDALPDLIPSLMATLKADTGAGDRLGSAQALSEVLAGLGTSRLEETLPTILQNVTSSKASVREGFMSLFIFLPACFGNSFANYLQKIIPPILAGLADEVDSIRETALRAGRLLVKNFATRSIDLLLPELERGLADDNYRIRLSSVELVGDLLFNLTGISGKEQDEDEDTAREAGQSLLEVLGEERRNRVLSSLYICRCDTSGLVRTAAVNVWKALVASPRTLRDLVPTLTQLLIRRLASSNMEHKVIAGNALGELIRKAGEGVLATLLPTLEGGLQTSTDSDAKQGICIALRELIASAAPESLEEYEKTLISVVRTALVDSDAEVREAAAEAFDELQRILGKKAVDQVLPFLLNLLRSEDEAQNALSALLTLLTEQTRSNIILPNLLPTLITSPMSAFNARAVASLAEVASSAMSRKLPQILNAIMDNIVVCKDDDLRHELQSSFDTVLVSVDENDGLSTAMSAMLALAKHDDHKRRSEADQRLAKFFAAADLDMSRYYPDLIRVLLMSFGDHDAEVVKSAHAALTALTARLKKEEMEALVISTRQVLQQAGVAGSSLPGFNLPKGINAILPIFLQGLMNGTPEQRTQAALAISDIIDRTSADSLRPNVTQITGPLIRVVSERSVDVKAAILYTLNNLLEKIPTFLKPFLPQLQRTFAKSLADTSSEILRIRAAKALGTLITLTPRIDPLIAELVTGSKTSDHGVKTAMLKALFEVVSKAGANMNEASRNSILGLIDADIDEADDAMSIQNSRLLGALIRNLPTETASALIKNRVLTTSYSKSSALALNAILLESPETLTTDHSEETVAVIAGGITNPTPVVADNCVLAAGKYLLTESANKSFDVTKPIFESLAQVIPPGHSSDTRRLALVVIRTISRHQNELVRPHLALLAQPIFASVRDMVIPVKLAAEAAFLAVFDVVLEESAVFEKYMAGPGASLAPGPKRSMQDYFKRVAIRLAGQARERKEAEGGQGGLGLSSDEVEDEREVWSVGKVELGEASFE